MILKIREERDNTHTFAFMRKQERSGRCLLCCLTSYTTEAQKMNTRSPMEPFTQSAALEALQPLCSAATFSGMDLRFIFRLEARSTRRATSVLLRCFALCVCADTSYLKNYCSTCHIHIFLPTSDRIVHNNALKGPIFITISSIVVWCPRGTIASFSRSPYTVQLGSGVITNRTRDH